MLFIFCFKLNVLNTGNKQSQLDTCDKLDDLSIVNILFLNWIYIYISIYNLNSKISSVTVSLLEI